MKRITSVLIALALAGAALPAAAQTAEASATLTVTGTGSVERAPDRATIPFTIVTNDADNTRALSANNSKYAAAVAALAKLGVEASSVRTTSFSSQFFPKPAKPDPSSDMRYGYTVSRSVSVQTDDLTKVGPIVDAITSSASADINEVSYGLRDPRAAQRAAQAAAVDDAVQQARNLAGAAGVRLVRILRIGNDPSGGIVPYRTSDVAMFAKAAAPVPTVLYPSPIQINASVALTYVIAAAN